MSVSNIGEIVGVAGNTITSRKGSWIYIWSKDGKNSAHEAPDEKDRKQQQAPETGGLLYITNPTTRGLHHRRQHVFLLRVCRYRRPSLPIEESRISWWWEQCPAAT